MGILQWTVGSILLVVLFLVNLFLFNLNRNVADDEPFLIWNTIYGTVLYHWGMLLTFYCLHNLSCGLTVRCDSEVYEVDIDIDIDSDDNTDENDENDDDNEVNQSSSSSSWWSSLFKKKKNNKKDNKNKMTKKEQEKQEKEQQRREAVAEANAMFIDTENAMSLVSSSPSLQGSTPTEPRMKSISFEEDNNSDDDDYMNADEIKRIRNRNKNVDEEEVGTDRP